MTGDDRLTHASIAFLIGLFVVIAGAAACDHPQPTTSTTEEVRV